MFIKQGIKKILPIFIVIIASVLVFIFLRSMKEPPKRMNNSNNILSVSTIDANIDDIQIKVPIIGKLLARNHVQIYAEVGGILEQGQKQFLEGVSYKKGEVLLSINSKDAEYNLMAQRSNLLTQIAQTLPEMKFDFPESFIQWENYLANFNVEQEIEFLPEPSNDREKYFVAGKGIYQTYYNIKNLENTFNKYRIKAPFNGTVVSSNIKPGTLARVGQPLGEFISNYIYDVESSVTVQQTTLIKIGDKAILKSENIAEAIKGKVSRINDNVDPDTQMVKIYITVSGSDLWEGMYLQGDIYSSTIVSATEIPRRIITNNNTVFVITDSIATEQKVEIISLNGDTAVVTGLNDSTRLITKSQNIYNGQKVNIL
ncbi:MAG: HlyD family efflux transporter periplasmic adaptor subunit [Candidatus Marinimicrobia bacterium]|nr:HlyD family efflux transporter periplasmic adaptor subunit [Candidatus Neomarinimicrobiota bacterium]